MCPAQIRSLADIERLLIMLWAFRIFTVVFPIVMTLIAHIKKNIYSNYTFCIFMLFSFLFALGSFVALLREIFGEHFNYDIFTILFVIVLFIILVHYLSMLVIHLKRKYDIKVLCRHCSTEILNDALDIFFFDCGLACFNAYVMRETMDKYYSLLKKDASIQDKEEAAVTVAKGLFHEKHSWMGNTKV